jgi:ATP-binding cassette, subfamily B, bacterial HlyB/CyaB
MEAATQNSGLQCLVLLLRFHQISVDPAQIAHQMSGVPMGVSEILRCAKSLKLRLSAKSPQTTRLFRFLRLIGLKSSSARNSSTIGLAARC